MTINSAPVKISARNVKANEKKFEPLRDDNGGRCIARSSKNANKRFCEIFPTDFWLQVFRTSLSFYVDCRCLTVYELCAIKVSFNNIRSHASF